MNQKEKVKVIQPRGIFDGRRGRKLYQEVMDSIDKDIETVLVDCQDIKLMDSSGFGTLLLILKTLRQRNRRLVICSLNDQMRMILELSDTAKVFEVFPDHTSFFNTLPQQ